MTASFLAEIAERVRAEVASPAYLQGVPPTPPSGRPSLRAALERERGRGALLVEYKRASPGATRPLPPPRSAPEFVRATDIDAVVGYSCLATAPSFDGAPARVAELARLTAKPVLFKEFILGPRQIEVAARTGAAAILLIARLEEKGLLDRPLRDLARDAHARGLEVLVEVHRASELSRLGDVSADMFGVNVRDLDTLKLDRPAARASLDAARAAGLRPLLGLSGVEGPAEAEAFWEAGCDGLLVGSAVARSPEPAHFLASLRRREARVP